MQSAPAAVIGVYFGLMSDWCLADKPRGWISMVVSDKSMDTYESDGDEKIGCEKHQPKFYPTSLPNPLAASAGHNLDP
jgi:hypothetical protein